MPAVAIIGASNNRAKYGNKAVRAYREAGWKVFPVNTHETIIETIPVFHYISDIKETIDRVALYVPPEVGLTLIPEIAQVKPRELYCNPGSESDALIAEARSRGLEPIVACAIIAIGKQPRNYH
ncbi:MAG: CoA-binding protein [Candidatus Kerfeldbacteria bacterium]|nr:CoA-binding protein [Candidatus Kerfeldbacteria bacterium]